VPRKPIQRRSTRQREAIRQVFKDHSRPLLPTEVLKAARRRVPNLGLATVYRTLKRLTEEGWLVGFGLPGQSQTYYERAQGHHHHFYCRECEKLFKVNCVPAHLKDLTPAGFVHEGHELVLYGLCKPCSDGAGAGSTE